MTRFRFAVKGARRFVLPAMLVASATCAAGLAGAATPVVTGGAQHAIVLKGDGTMAGWGDNSAGQLGLGARVFTTTPIQVAGVPAAKAASAGIGHALVLAQDGTVWSWGLNSYGQLGDGTQISRNVPVHVAGLSNVVQIAAGGSHSVALKADGTVWSWGLNTLGAVGDGTTTNRDSPVQVQGLGPVAFISAGLNHTVVLQADGKVFAWGDNSLSQVDGITHGTYPIPHGVGGFGNITAIAASGTTSFAVASNGWVYWWGSMRNSAPGGTPGVSRVAQLTNIAAVASGATAIAHTLFIDNSGLAFWYNDVTQTTAGLLGETPQTFVTIAGLSTAAMGVSAGGDYVDPNFQIAPPGGSFSTVLLTDGTVASLGLNSFGQLGNASDQATLKGVAVPGISNAVSVSSGNAFGIAVTADGTVWTWGDNVYGELGDGTTLATTVPEVIPGVSDVSTIVSGYGFSAALKTDGTAVAWGDNTLGQAGNGLRFAKQAAPAPVIGLAGMKAIAAGMTHALTLGSDGTIWSWGDNSMGELGRATTASGIAGANAGLIAGQKSDFVDGVAVAAGNGFSLALKSDGTVWTWGADITGQTGCTSFQPPCSVDPTVPRQVPMLNNIVQIAAGVDFALALKNDGTVYSFGSNTNGQLGSGVILQATQNLPARVKGLPAAAKIAAGGRHALAVLANGAVWSWGWNSFGQLGNGATTDNPLPALMNLTTPVSSAGAGYQFSYAAVQGGPLLAWGDNRLGEMGDGTYVMRARPVAVVHEGGTGNIATNDWFLIPDPTSPVVVAASLAPPILIQSRATGIQQALAVSTSVTFLSGDTGNSGVIHVTAKIPPNSLPVLAGFAMQDALRQATTVADPSTFVLVQLTPSGWQVVDNLQLIPLATGTLGSSIATQTIMAGIDVTQLAGAQFCIGYGASAGAMLANQTIRVAYAVAGGPAGVSCVPPSATVIPQNGVWWNPAEGGRGYTIEYNGTNLFMATYLYDATGRSTWYGAGPAPMSGSTFNAPLTSYYGGQTLTGNYQIATQGESPGNISITFTDPTHGTLTWPGVTIPIQRYEFVQNGLNLPPTASQPQTGWWWYPSEGGRGYSVEVQGNSAFIASYMYDANGNPVWYASGPAALVNDVYQGEWLSYVGGQTLTGSYQSPTGASAAGALTIQFSSPTTGLLSLPNGRVIPIQRFSF